MAYDPEARETSNSALIIGIVALVLVIGGALAYYATNSSTPNVSSPTVIVEHPVVNSTPADAVAPTPMVIEKQVPVPGPATHTTIDRTTTTTRVISAPGAKANARPGAAATPAATPGTTTSTTTTTTTENAASDNGNSASNAATANTANNAGY